MLRTLIGLGAALFCAAGVASAASAASFDCGEARAPDEVAVCGSPALSALDSEMAGLWYAFGKVPMLMGARGARHDEAEAFLQRRRQCGSDQECLTTAYRDRVGALRQRIASAMSGVQAEITGAGQPGAATTLPAPVAAALSGYAPQCAQLGGTLANPDAAGVMAADLDGDGRMDYVLNPQPLDCSGAATAFCGNSGCDIRLHLSRKDYADPISVFGGQPTLTQRDGRTDAEIWVGRTNCKDMNAGEACWAVYSWSGGDDAPAVEYEARPEPS